MIGILNRDTTSFGRLLFLVLSFIASVYAVLFCEMYEFSPVMSRASHLSRLMLLT
jgi:hypothetical protein